MSRKDDVREFLISRRANITPEQAGLPNFGEERRVPGLRREEVAMLAGVSLDYYTQLERGNLRGASESVLNAIARALQLDDVEREYLFDLARVPATPTAQRERRARPAVRASVQRVLDNLNVPAVVVNAQQDLVACNLMGRALFSPHFETENPNLARFIFLDSRARDFYVDWALACSMTAAMLRLEAGRDPLNSELTALIGELSTRSPQFRQDWPIGTSTSTAPGARSTATQKSARSTSPSTCSSCPANQVCPSPPTASRRPVRPPTSSPYSPPGPPPSGSVAARTSTTCAVPNEPAVSRRWAPTTERRLRHHQNASGPSA